MLFNSPLFLFAFLPAVLAGYYLCLRLAGKKAAQLWLFVASLVFYAAWDVSYLPLLLAAMAFNYALGTRLARRPDRRLLACGITVNLLALGFFKYAAFAVQNLNVLASLQMNAPQIVLPLGISFFTFQKIAWLVDCHRRQATTTGGWANFGLFVMFFPQLVAGPIVHHREMMPQFDRLKRLTLDDMTAGLCLLLIGLGKKIFIADGLDAYATPLFSAAEARPLHIVEAWAAMLSYSFQIYFDFSGYSDMALGLGRMFGVRLPVNFFSPYKAGNIADFWRRWHMTLSRFLRDYLYIPLGGNRRGPARRTVNLMLTMLLGGLWHGASWTFVAWGGLHGAFLALNHAWRGLGLRMSPWPARALTFLCVALAWVFFRAADMKTALSILSSLTHIADLGGLPLHEALAGKKSVLRRLFDAAAANRAAPLLLLCLAACWLLPNSVEIMRRVRPAISGMRSFFPLPRGRGRGLLVWAPSLGWGLAFGALAAACLVKVLYEPSQVFLYFQF